MGNFPYSSKQIKADIETIDANVDSALKEIIEVEKHIHSPETWRGLKAVPTATLWADDVLTPFVAISGNNTYGADANDEAEVIGTANTPVRSGMTKFDLHRLLVTDVDHDTPYKLRIICGTGTMADAITALQYTEVVVQFDATNPQLSAGIPVEVQMPRCNAGADKVWIQAWNATDDSQIDFLVGFHEYLV